MTEKIDIAEILKDKPANTKLYSPLFGEVYFSHVGGGNIAVEHHGGISLFFSSGRFFDYDESEPLLFPSKEMRNWSKFAWKKGDVLYSAGLKEYCVFNKFISDGYLMFISKYNVDENTKRVVPKTYDPDKNTVNYEKVSDEKATEIISLIEEHYGGKLNLATLEIEKQPEFKDGDVLFVKCRSDDFIEIFNYSKKNGDLYDHASLVPRTQELDISGKYKIRKDEIVEIRLATEEEKKQLFSVLAKKGKTWDSEKKAIVGLKPKFDELKPFDKVLVRDSESDKWRANLFAYISEDGYYCCVYAFWVYCIPYAGNEHLLGTTNNVEG